MRNHWSFHPNSKKPCQSSEQLKFARGNKVNISRFWKLQRRDLLMWCCWAYIVFLNNTEREIEKSAGSAINTMCWYFLKGKSMYWKTVIIIREMSWRLKKSRMYSYSNIDPCCQVLSKSVFFFLGLVIYFHVCQPQWLQPQIVIPHFSQRGSNNLSRSGHELVPSHSLRFMKVQRERSQQQRATFCSIEAIVSVIGISASCVIV